MPNIDSNGAHHDKAGKYTHKAMREADFGGLQPQPQTDPAYVYDELGVRRRHYAEASIDLGPVVTTSVEPAETDWREDAAQRDAERGWELSYNSDGYAQPRRVYSSPLLDADEGFRGPIDGTGRTTGRSYPEANL